MRPGQGQGQGQGGGSVGRDARCLPFPAADPLPQSTTGNSYSPQRMRSAAQRHSGTARSLPRLSVLIGAYSAYSVTAPTHWGLLLRATSSGSTMHGNRTLPGGTYRICFTIAELSASACLRYKNNRAVLSSHHVRSRRLKNE